MCGCVCLCVEFVCVVCALLGVVLLYWCVALVGVVLVCVVVIGLCCWCVLVFVVVRFVVFGLC